MTPEKGSLSSGWRTTGSPAGVSPWTAGMSAGDGRKSTTASSRGCTPLFLKALPQKTGTILPSTTPVRSPERICSVVRLSFSK